MTEDKKQNVELNDAELDQAQGGLLPAVKTGIVDGTSNINDGSIIAVRKAGEGQPGAPAIIKTGPGTLQY